MPRKDPRIDAYIRKSAAFAQPILRHLRKLVRANCPAVEETMKWGFPHFMHRGILCSMAAFTAHCTFGFWNRELVLGKGKAAKETAHGQFGRIAARSDLPSDKALAGYIKRAVELNEAGTRKAAPARPKFRAELLVPEDLLRGLRNSKRALATFEQFSYSHKKEYIQWLAEAKRDETRLQRLETAIAWMAEGKPRHWKYQNCQSATGR
jgi:uncharacterized protein YdeI (YjbR/CyaY-like superfamily)